MSASEQLPDLLAAALSAESSAPGDIDETEIRGLTRLSGGANMETWAFDWLSARHHQALILRRRPSGISAHPILPKALSLEAEGALLSVARRTGVPVPTVVASTAPGSPLGEALIMTRLDGEALPNRILRDDRYATARARLAFQCGEALGRLHAADIAEAPAGLRDLGWDDDLVRLQEQLNVFGNPSPALELALRTLRTAEQPTGRRVICHGDFRLGNLLINEQGLAAVLDWELAHIGFPGEDLGYLCANVWRFSGELPVGGFGRYQDLVAGYRSVRDWAPTMNELLLWQLYAALGWGLVCLTMLELHESGADSGLERAAVGRRLSEAEIDCLLLMDSIATEAQE
ncbi:MAG: phosphotransferase family protein [Congregibacter sp.]